MFVLLFQIGDPAQLDRGAGIAPEFISRIRISLSAATVEHRHCNRPASTGAASSQQTIRLLSPQFGGRIWPRPACGQRIQARDIRVLCVPGADNAPEIWPRTSRIRGLYP